MNIICAADIQRGIDDKKQVVGTRCHVRMNGKIRFEQAQENNGEGIPTKNDHRAPGAIHENGRKSAAKAYKNQTSGIHNSSTLANVDRCNAYHYDQEPKIYLLIPMDISINWKYQCIEKEQPKPKMADKPHPNDEGKNRENQNGRCGHQKPKKDDPFSQIILMRQQGIRQISIYPSFIASFGMGWSSHFSDSFGQGFPA
jgi:hypothetical protein